MTPLQIARAKIVEATPEVSLRMEPLEFIPRSIFSGDFDLMRAEAAVGSLTFSAWGNGGSFVIGGSRYSIESKGVFNIVHTARRGDAVFGEATPESGFGGTIRVNTPSGVFVLDRGGWGLKQGLEVLLNDITIGSITRDKMFSRQGRCSMSTPFPDEVLAFLTWLTIRTWNEDESAAATTAAI